MIHAALITVNAACRTMSVFKNFANGVSLSSLFFCHSLTIGVQIAKMPKICHVYTSAVIIFSYKADSESDAKNIIMLLLRS